MIKIGDTFSHKSDAGYVMSHVEVIALSDKYMTLKNLLAKFIVEKYMKYL